MRPGGLALVVLLGAATLSVQPLARAQGAERTFETDHFSFTWIDDSEHPAAPDLFDGDGDGVPDGIELTAGSWEDARSFLLDELGYREPPVDDLYPVYVAAIDQAGVTRIAPGGEGVSKPSFTLISSRAVSRDVPVERMRSLAVHEYFHAIQHGYDANEDGWIAEASSAWVEDVFVDAIDPQHVALRDFVPRFRSSLTDTDGRQEYGAFLFVEYLVERFGADPDRPAIVKELWEVMGAPPEDPNDPGATSVEALEAMLARRGSSLADAWAEFNLWRRRPAHFEEGAGYRAALAGTEWRKVLRTSRVATETCRRTSDAGEDRLPALSADFVRLRPHRSGPLEVSAHLAVEGPEGTGAFALVRRLDGSVEELMVDVEGGVGTLELPFGRSEITEVTVGLANGSLDDATIGYALRIEGRPSVDVTAPSGPFTVVYGSPAVISGDVTCRGKPAPFADVTVVQTLVDGGEPLRLEAETDSSGHWSLRPSPEARADYAVEVTDPLLSLDAAGTHRVEVELFLTIVAVERVVAEGEPVQLSGVVQPPHDAVPVVIEFRRPEGDWREGVRSATDASGAYSGSLTLPAGGIWEVRVRATETGDEDHLPGTSGRIQVRVRRATGG